MTDHSTEFQQRFESELDRRGARSNDMNARSSGDPARQGVGPGVLYPALSHAIVGAAIRVHRHIGAGQLESVYQTAMVHELGLQEIPYRTQVPVDLLYKGLFVTTFRLDLVVDDRVVVELKAVERYHPAHRAQVVSYLRATGLRLGLLINFNAPMVHQTVMRIIV